MNSGTLRGTHFQNPTGFEGFTQTEYLTPITARTDPEFWMNFPYRPGAKILLEGSSHLGNPYCWGDWDRVCSTTREPLRAVVCRHSTTALPLAAEDLHSKVIALFEGARDISFEDGVETEFSKGIDTLVIRHGAPAVDAITNLILSGRTNPAMAAEALRWIGRIDDSPSYRARLWLLERCLANGDPQVRDGAILGLCSLDDPHSIRYVERAIANESYPEILQELEHLLAQLQNTKQCRWF